MYYVLQCYGPEDQDRTTLGSIPDIEGINWNLGRPFQAEIRQHLSASLNASFPGLLMPMYKKGILLMSDQMISTLREAGIDNLELYDVLLEIPFENKIISTFKAVNILGLVASANLSESEHTIHSGTALIDVDFDSLVIDEERTRGFLIFRLAECVSAIIIHESVKEKLVQSGIDHLDFVEPANWIG